MNSLPALYIVGAGCIGRRIAQAIAQGELAPPADSESAPAEKSLIDAAFMDAELDDIQAGADAIDRAVAALETIESTFVEKVGPVDSPDFGELPADRGSN